MELYYNLDKSLPIQIEEISKKVDYELNSQNKKINILVDFFKKVNPIIQGVTYENDAIKIVDLLEELKINLAIVKDCSYNLKILRQLLNELSNYFSSDENANLDDTLIAKINQYNDSAKIYETHFYNNITVFEDFILKYLNNGKLIQILSIDTSSSSIDSNIQHSENSASLTDSLQKFQSSITSFSDAESTNNVTTSVNSKNVEQGESYNKSIDNSQSQEEDSSITDNRVLLISEKQNKVFLPYDVTDLKRKLKHNSNYKSLQDVINNEYIFPFSKYKNSIISRFKESYNLMRKKEHASVLDSLDLALELTFNTMLNPAIISACKSLDELDIYVDCLESNELDKFKIFEIKYEILPR